MGDHTDETSSQLQSRLNEEEYAREQQILGEKIMGQRALHLNVCVLPWVFNHMDCFAAKCRLNKSIEDVVVYPFSFDGQGDHFWDKVGESVGSLPALKNIFISTHSNHYAANEVYDDDQVVPIPDWEILACILSHVRQKVSVEIHDYYYQWATEEVQPFIRAIHGHPTIRSFEGGFKFPYEFLDTLYSTLATLPALESIECYHGSRPAEARYQGAWPEDESTLANLKSLTDLLRRNALRSVSFYCFSFTPAVCQVVASVLIEGTAITSLKFSKCKFSVGECDSIMANGLARNTSVISISVIFLRDEVLVSALATALPSNATLRELSFSGAYCDPPGLSPVLLALKKNTALKTLSLQVCDSSTDDNELLSAAMKDGLGTNSTLESLHLSFYNTALWCGALSFLRTNKALKSLSLGLDDQTPSSLSSLRMEIAAMLEENVSLETLSISSWHETKPQDYAALITALQRNTTLKTLEVHTCCHQLTTDEDKQLALLLKKNYALESLSFIDFENKDGDAGAILRLNGAGRRYLIENGSSISRGVEVLSAVSDETNCVYLHLLENPGLCG
jgi:hypothetical protein